MRAYLNSFILMTALVVGLVFTGCQEEVIPPRVIETSTITDIDGNVYKTVKIGNQWWMAENLKVTRFNDSSSVAFISVNALNSDWQNTADPTYTSLNDSQYGLLYNYDLKSINNLYLSFNYRITYFYLSILSLKNLRSP